jgi:hypothetical protein
VIALVIVVNTTIGVIQEVRADRAVTALARDGRQQEMAAADSYRVMHWCWPRGIWLQPTRSLLSLRLCWWTSPGCSRSLWRLNSLAQACDELAGGGSWGPPVRRLQVRLPGESDTF